MIFTTVLIAFLAGLACGLALRPALDRRRQLRQAYSMARTRRSKTSAPIRVDTDPVFVPRDYYLADRRQRGTLSEEFGLKRRSTDIKEKAVTPEADAAPFAMPRDYYDRNAADDEGTLSETYGLRDGSTGKSAG